MRDADIIPGRGRTLCFATDVGGLICTDTTWTLAGSPYVVTGSSGIVIGCNATLTIEPGVIVKFSPTLAIVVGSNAFGNGCLVARGTAESPIIFTSIKDPNNVLDPAKPGDWSRIHFTDYSVDAVFDGDDNYVSGGILEYVIVEYGGYGDPGTNYGAIFAEKSSPFLNYCEVRHGSYYGIRVDGSNAPAIKITNCEVRDNSQCGIYISGGSDHKLLYNNVHDNRGGGIYCDGAYSALSENDITQNSGTGIVAAGAGSILSGNSVTQNTGMGIVAGGGSTLTGNNVTQNTGTGIVAGGGSTLTENTVTENSAAGLSFAGGSNILMKNTISDNTSMGGDSGGILFTDYCGGNTLIENTITDNASSDAGGGICFGGWRGNAGGNTLTGNTISGNRSSNRGGGIFFGEGGSGSNTLTGNTITDNTTGYYGGGIYFRGSDNNTLTQNTITGNTSIADGGGLSFDSSGGNTLRGNSITDNTSNDAGGGIYFTGSGSNTLTQNVVQSNISRNGLGVVYIESSGDTVFLQNTITDNYIETGTTGGIYVTGNSERVSLAGDPSSHTYNIIQDNDGYWIYNGNNFNADGRNDVNAVYVQWGTSDILLIMERIFDYFDDGSKAFVLFYPFVMPGDFDYDEDADWLDLVTLVENWLRQDCIIPDWCEGADLDVNTTVDFFDFARFADNWLEGVSP